MGADRLVPAGGINGALGRQTTGVGMLKVLVCDERPLVTRALTKMLGNEADVEVVGVADSTVHAMILVQELQPDVVVAGLHLHGASGARPGSAAARGSRSTAPRSFSTALRTPTPCSPTHCMPATTVRGPPGP